MATKKHKDFIKNQEYPGGKNALKAFIKSNLVYPKEALEKKIQGTVFLSYTIDVNGIVSSAKILKGIGFGCDEEAIRLVKLLKFSPQNNRGLRVSNTNKVRINFKLEEQTQVKQTTITYKYTTNSNSKPEQGKSNRVYTFTITSKTN